MTKKTGARRDRKKIFLNELALHGIVKKACDVAGLSRQQVRDLKIKDDQFAAAYEDALEDYVDDIEYLAVSKAKEGNTQWMNWVLEKKRYKPASDINLSGIKPVIQLSVEQ